MNIHEEEYSISTQKLTNKINDGVKYSETVLSFIGQTSGVDFAFKEQGIVLDVGDVVKDGDEGECGTA